MLMGKNRMGKNATLNAFLVMLLCVGSPEHCSGQYGGEAASETCVDDPTLSIIYITKR